MVTMLGEDSSRRSMATRPVNRPYDRSDSNVRWRVHRGNEAIATDGHTDSASAGGVTDGAASHWYG